MGSVDCGLVRTVGSLICCLALQAQNVQRGRALPALFSLLAWLHTFPAGAPLALINKYKVDDPDYAQWQQWGDEILVSNACNTRC